MHSVPREEMPLCQILAIFLTLEILNIISLEDAVLNMNKQGAMTLLGHSHSNVGWDPGHVCDLHHSSWQCQILNALREARNGTCVLMDASQIHFC